MGLGLALRDVATRAMTRADMVRRRRRAEEERSALASNRALSSTINRTARARALS